MSASAMQLVSLLAFCCVAGERWVQGQHQVPVISQDIIKYLQDLREHVAGLELRLEDHDKTLSMYKQTVNDQDTKLLQQELVIHDLRRRLSQQERTSQEQERIIERQDARLSQQEQAIKLLNSGRVQQMLSTPEQHSKSLHQKQTTQEQQDLLDDWRNVSIVSFNEKDEVDGRRVDAISVLEKRSDDGGPLEAMVDQMAQQAVQMSADIQALRNANQQQDQARGTTYIRWGSAGCPASSELVYTGIISGTHYSDAGGAANHLCLTSTPVFDAHVQPSGNSYASIYGSEYQICPETECQTTPACAVCRVARASTVMIPGTNTCTPGWILEYSGYIMAGYQGYTGSSEFICVDSSRTHYANTSQANDDQNLIYYTHTKCGALPCPPYVENKIVTCTVCSK